MAVPIANLGTIGEWMDAALCLPPPSEEEDFQASDDVLVWVQYADGRQRFTDSCYLYNESRWNMGSAEGYTVIAWALVDPPDEMKRSANHSTAAIALEVQLDG